MSFHTFIPRNLNVSSTPVGTLHTTGVTNGGANSMLGLWYVKAAPDSASSSLSISGSQDNSNWTVLGSAATPPGTADVGKFWAFVVGVNNYKYFRLDSAGGGNTSYIACYSLTGFNNGNGPSNTASDNNCAEIIYVEPSNTPS